MSVTRLPVYVPDVEDPDRFYIENGDHCRYIFQKNQNDTFYCSGVYDPCMKKPI